jgi:hypothetical protein
MSAVLSDCGKYRYHLHRSLGVLGSGTCTFIMLNPSTADAMLDDPTIRRCMGYARSLGCEHLEVVNLFAYRSTSPDVLYAMSRDTAVGPDNDRHIVQACALAAYVICGWGNHGSAFGRDKEVLKLLSERNVRATALKINAKSQQPAHPLYLKGDAVPFDIHGRTE